MADIKQTYRVWIQQINQTYVDVEAESQTDAINKAARKWHKEECVPEILDVREIAR